MLCPQKQNKNKWFPKKKMKKEIQDIPTEREKFYHNVEKKTIFI